MASRINHSLLLCFLAAVMEGIDIIAFGLAAAEMRTALNLTTEQIAITASANMAAFILGSLAAGRGSDRYGRKVMLVASMAIIGVFSLATAAASSFETMFIFRTLTGVGLGGAMPMFIALAAESGAPAGRVARVSVMLSGSPLGGILAGLFVASAWGADWRGVFILGGIGPLLLVPLLWRGLAARPELEAGDAAAPAPADQSPTRSFALRALLGEGRGVLTCLLWLGLLATQVLTYIMFNWLPILLRDLGLERWEASTAMSVFMAAAVVGNIAIARFVSGSRRWIAVAVVFVGTVVSLLAYGAPSQSFLSLAIISGFAGMFILSATVLLYGLATDLYPLRVRGVGVGAATAMGRVGAIAGPLLAGVMLDLGVATGALLPAIAPFALVGGAAAVLLARKVSL
ncbi:MAG: MFS transporter [Hyphomonadaceae bacterium]